MIYLVYGGSGSGKSEFAEALAVDLAGADGRKIYLATMQADGGEAQNRIERHKKLRAGKGFETIEQSRNIEEAVEGEENTVILLECMSNLLANEMFCPEAKAAPGEKSAFPVAEKILWGIKRLSSACKSLIIVSNNIFDDGIDYDLMTKKYMAELSFINCQLAKQADKLYEVVCGIPLEVK